MRQLYLLIAAAVGFVVFALMYMTTSYADGTVGFLHRAAQGDGPVRSAENLDGLADRVLGYLDFYRGMIWILALAAIASLTVNYFLATRVEHYKNIAHGLGYSGKKPPSGE